MEVKKNDEINLNIEALTSEGSAVGHYNGLAVFVRGAVPGDEIVCHIIKTAKRYAIGKISSIVKSSPSRRESDCPVSDKCGGCSFRNMTYDEEIRFKKQRVYDAVSRIAHLDVKVNDVVKADNIYEYRNKAQYPVFIENGKLHAGFYAYKSHRIVPCKSCKLQNKVFEEILNAITIWAEKSNISSYNEKTGKGLLRHIYLRIAEGSGEIMVCLVINADTLPSKEEFVASICKINGVESICININKSQSNVILGNETVVLWGKNTICDILLGKRFEISPQSFYQVNHNQCEKLYKKAKEYACFTGEETVVDLYCGAGTIGLSIADNAKKLFGVEIVEDAVKNAVKNAEINNIRNAEFFCGDAFEAAKELEKRSVKADVVILDPPRKGCQAELFEVIKNMGAKRIVYVSCDSATLARDLEILDKSGYKTQEITPVDMFPRTPHIEAIACVKREENGN